MYNSDGRLDADSEPHGSTLGPPAIRERFRWARRRGHPGWLWPEVSVSAWRRCLGELEDVTRRVVGPRTSEEGELGPAKSLRDDRGAVDERPAPALVIPEGASLRALGIAAFTSGLGPLLGRWIEEGRLRAIAPVATLLSEHLAHGRDRADRTREILSAASGALAGTGISPTLLKGGHVARSYFPEPGTRPTSDVDLAVSATCFPEAEAALGAAGFELLERQPRPRRSVWRPPGEGRHLRSLALTHRDNPITVDLHASLERDFFGVRTLEFGELTRASEPWTDRLPDLRILKQPGLTAYLAAHASEGLHGLTLLRQVELVLVLRTDLASGRLDWTGLEAYLAELGALRFVYPAFALAERLAPGTVEPRFLAHLEQDAPASMLRVIRDLRPSDAQRMESLSLDERFMWARGVREWVRRAVHMAWPSWIGTTVPELLRVYAERVFRLVRGRVGLRRPPSDTEGRPR